MTDIVNINALQNNTTKRIIKNLSLEIGEVFLARIVDWDRLSNEILIKMLDGWQFYAKLREQPNFISPQGLVKFQVQGFEDEKVIISTVPELESADNFEYDSIEDILKEQNIYKSKNNILILKSMVKHGIPLTKGNIYDVKTIIDFKEKIILNLEEEDEFIHNYLNSKNIDPESEEGIQLRQILKEFFIELKDLSLDEFLTMRENSIELTKENIKSFKDLFIKDNISLYSKLISEVEINSKPTVETVFEIVENNKIVKDFLSFEKILPKTKDIMELRNQIISEPQKEGEFISEYIYNKDMDPKSKDAVNIKETLEVFFSELKNLDMKHLQGKRYENTSEIVKEQINDKTNEVKGHIKNIVDKIETKYSSDNRKLNNISLILKESINDLKVFNSVSNQYYYLELPIENNHFEYKCKLIIKDKRKDGKVIDSDNVKMAISVKTSNIGIIDTYIHINKQSMNIEMQCDNKWVPLLKSNSNKIVKKFSNLKYNIFINIKKKETQGEMTLVNCREFFNDNSINEINVVV